MSSSEGKRRVWSQFVWLFCNWNKHVVSEAVPAAQLSWPPLVSFRAASTTPRLCRGEWWQGLLVTGSVTVFLQGWFRRCWFISAARKGGVSPAFGLWEKEPAIANWRLQQAFSSGSWAISATRDCCSGKLFSWWFHCYGSRPFCLCSQGIPYSQPPPVPLGIQWAFD